MHQQLGLVAQQDMFDNGQPQTGPPRSTRTPAIDAVKPLGQTRNMFRCNADAGVGDAELGLRSAAIGRYSAPLQADAAAFGGVAHRVADQVGQSRVQFLRAAPHRQVAVRLQFDLVPSARQRQRLGLELPEHGRHVDGQLCRRIGIALQPRKGQQILDQMPHPVGLGLHQVQHVQALGLVERHVAQGFDESAQHGQRSLDLVRDVRHEITAHRLGALELGDVLREQQLLSVAIWKDLHTQGELRMRPSPVHLQGLMETLPLQIGDEFRVADQMHRMLAQIALRIEAEMQRCGCIEPVDLVVLVEQHHPVGRHLQGLDETLQLGLFVSELAVPDAQLARGAIKHFSPGARAVRDRRRVGGLEPANETRQRQRVTPEHEEQHDQSAKRGASDPVQPSSQSGSQRHGQKDDGNTRSNRQHRVRSVKPVKVISEV
ncbi:hypothetical protein GALL_511090 [mine drainage metagenome]|uniref:Uncharacterized protein n=1 Tax=mine drainage metagenome TaxID=410659 RepID=A0A1J5P6V6_9ZZZZ